MMILSGRILHQSFQWLRRTNCKSSSYQKLFFALEGFCRSSSWVGFRNKKWMECIMYVSPMFKLLDDHSHPHLILICLIPRESGPINTILKHCVASLQHNCQREKQIHLLACVHSLQDCCSCSGMDQLVTMN